MNIDDKIENVAGRWLLFFYYQRFEWKYDYKIAPREEIPKRTSCNHFWLSEWLAMSL